MKGVVRDVWWESENRHVSAMWPHLFEWGHDVTQQQVALRYQFLGRLSGINCGKELAASLVLKMRQTALSNKGVQCTDDLVEWNLGRSQEQEGLGLQQCKSHLDGRQRWGPR